jgi:hypothetical protein
VRHLASSAAMSAARKTKGMARPASPKLLPVPRHDGAANWPRMMGRR